MMLKVAGVLVPALLFVWTIMTVMALHRREVYFWSLGSTWTSIVAAFIALFLIPLAALHAEGDSVNLVPLLAAAVLYATSIAFAFFYNLGRIGHVGLTLSTVLLQQLAVLGVLYLVWRIFGSAQPRHRSAESNLH